MKKALILASVASMIDQFNMANIDILQKAGYKVHVAANFNYGSTTSKERTSDLKKQLHSMGVIVHDVAINRSVLNISNIHAYNVIKNIINHEAYDLIHCHSPIGGVITRLAAKAARKKGTKVIYTVHGFHFFKGAPIKNWLVYFPIEKWLSKYTDYIITINQEDYYNATNKKFKVKNIKLVNGIGIDLEKFKPQTKVKKSELRRQYGYSDDDFILLYTAELNYNKHQDLIINVINLLKDKIPNIKLLLAGLGTLQDKYKQQRDSLNLNSNVKFLGYRNDIVNLLTISDIVVSASRREGLPVNIMEAMATGLPLVVTDCRGNRDLVCNEENGFVIDIDDIEGFANAIEKLYTSKKLRQKFGRKNLEIINSYSLENVKKEMKNIYF